jgi:hypothetical protein
MASPALVQAYEASEAIERRIHALETKPALDIDRVERAVGGVRRPEELAERLGPAIRYSQRVEAEVADLSIATLLPEADHAHLGRFLTIWTPDELGHAHAQEVLLDHLGLPAYEPRSESVVPLHNRLVGRLGRFSPHVHDMVAMAYHTIGAINEKLALSAYDRMGTICRDMGEDELADELFASMRRDEAGHLGYYRTTARQLRHHLSSWQMAVVRFVVVHTYAPVGAGQKKDKPPFGACLQVLATDPDNPEIAPQLQKIADELLSRDGQHLPPFVLQELRACLALARQNAVA